MITVNNNGSVLNRSVLVLNTNYAPLDICTTRRAICLFFNQKVEILESYNESVHSPSTALSLPSIIKLRNFVKYHKLDVFDDELINKFDSKFDIIILRDVIEHLDNTQTNKLFSQIRKS